MGQRNEAFKLSLGEVFDLVNFVPIEGDSAPGAADGGGFPGGVTQDPERNILARNNMTSLALEIHRDCLTRGDDVASALKQYEGLRRDRTASVQNGSRRNATVFHLSGMKAWARNLAASKASGSTFDRLYRYNVLEALSDHERQGR